MNRYAFAGDTPITATCRKLKSAAAIALIQRAMDNMMEVHRAAARSLQVADDLPILDNHSATSTRRASM